MQSFPVAFDCIFSSQLSCHHSVPSGLERARRSPTYSFCVHCSLYLGMLPIRAALGGILPCQSQGCHTPHAAGHYSTSWCPGAHLLLETTSVDSLTCLWSYSPARQSKLHVRNSVLSFLPLASVPQTGSGTTWILGKYLLVENFISISLLDSPASFLQVQSGC